MEIFLFCENFEQRIGILNYIPVSKLAQETTDT